MIVFVDTETGGLDPTKHPLIEVAWATLDDQEPKTIIMPHIPNAVGPEAAGVNHYHERDLANPDNWATQEQITEFFRLLPGATLCAANPSFDAGFLNANYQGSPFARPLWNYRMLDIASMFVARCPKAFRVGEEGLPGLRHIVEWINTDERESSACTEEFHDECMHEVLPSPNHTAAGDVKALLGVWNWMFSGYSGRPGGW